MTVTKQNTESSAGIGATCPSEDGNLWGWIDALDVDPSYRPPLEQRPKPIACFYVLRSIQPELGQKEYHRAVYLMHRTVNEFACRIAAKWGINHSQIIRTIHETEFGLEVEIDDDAVGEIKEGQDMILEIEEMEQSLPVKQNCEANINSNNSSTHNEFSDMVSGGFILRLNF